MCLRSLARPASRTSRRTITLAATRDLFSAGVSQQRLRAGYFLNNAFLVASGADKKGASLSSAATVPSSQLPAASTTLGNSSSKNDLPHRRRQRERREAAAPAVAVPLAGPVVPPDASSTLTTLSSKLPVNSIRRTLSTLLALSKPRLSFMIVLTATTAYSLYPVPAVLSPTITDTPSLSALTLLYLTVGTGLSSASANALNMLYEPKWDAMMSRTRNRPLVRGLISGRGAFIFALISGATGVAALYYGVNPTVAFLGGLNIVLYAGVYTPLKRVSAVNTWVGAIVGAIPPMMGWAAAAGQSATRTGDWRELLLGEQSIGGWLIAGLLFAWQFPHFMALSWPIRLEYKDAGYKMLAWTNPARNGRVALRYSLLFVPVCIAMCYVGITEWSFVALSAPVNVWLAREAYYFWKHEGQKGSARGLFWASVWHLPVVMVLAMLAKKGMWQRAWRSAVGEPDPYDDEWLDDDEDESVIKSVTPVARNGLSR
jgi:heme o synthase